MKKYINILIIFMAINISVFAQNDNVIKSGNDNSRQANDIQVMIEIANPKIFYTNDEVYINVKIFNKSSDDKYFKISDDKRFSIDFRMVTMQNKPLEHSTDYITSFHRVQNNFYSTVKLSPGEGYLFKIRLNDYYDLNNPGQYFIRGDYYPDLKVFDNEMQTGGNSAKTGETTGMMISSNQIALNIRPSEIKENIITEERSMQTEKKEFATKRSPDEVVSYMLKARMNGEWDKFFLYLDLDSLIQTNSNFWKRYQKSDIEKQKVIINEYKEYLKRDRIDDISFLPTRFQIINTEYSDGNGKVYVLADFKYQDYTEKKYYTYFLTKKDNIWYITSYEVYNYQ